MNPPDDARIMMRWWWFGPAVSNEELEREIVKMKEGGIGGFEIQPVYALELDDPQKGFRNFPYLSADFLDALRFANQKGRELGMRVDVTVGSGWPWGGPHIPVTQASSRLRLAVAAVSPNTDTVSLPAIANGEKLIAAFIAPGTVEKYDTAQATQLGLPGENQYMLQLPASANSRVALFFVASRTGQLVKRPAVNADGFVLDHMDKFAVENHLHNVGDVLMQAFGDEPPYAIFSDSLEAYSADWTGDFVQEFRTRRGYDIVPYLPTLFSGAGPEAASIRHDWGQTLTELTNERYLIPAREWAAQHHTQFRSQTYGFPPVTLSSNNLVDLPEGEGPQWRGFSTTRWATSGSHLYGRNVTSAETWTWLHSPAFRATPLDMKAEADRMFLQGVNQIVGHGWPYSPKSAGDPGWAFYAAGAFNDHNPWWPVMPELSRYLQRVSYLMRQGTPVNDVAVYLPTDDAYARFSPGHASVNELMKEIITGTVAEQILDAGFNFDYIDSAAIETRGLQYPILILPNVQRIPLSTYRKISEYAKQGGKVIAIGSAPSIGPGFRDAEIAPQIQEISNMLFRADGAPGKIVASDSSLESALKEARTPDVQTTPPAAQIGFVHRRLPYADIYFVANTSNEPVNTVAKFQSPYANYEWWDPMSGKTVETRVSQKKANPGHHQTQQSSEMEITLAPYESRVLVVSSQVSQKKANLGHHPANLGHDQVSGEKVLADLSQDWKVSFGTIDHAEQFATLHPWTEDPKTRFFSGEAVYEKDFAFAKNPAAGASVVLDFGEGTPVPPESGKLGMRALLEGPVREIAIIYINGKLAGSVWHPPYRLDVTSFLKAGNNHIEIRVANLAINTLAGRTLPDYRLLNSRYGERFQMQDMKDLRPLPSGILGPIKVILY